MLPFCVFCGLDDRCAKQVERDVMLNDERLSSLNRWISP